MGLQLVTLEKVSLTSCVNRLNDRNKHGEIRWHRNTHGVSGTTYLLTALEKLPFGLDNASVPLNLWKKR